MPARGGSQLMRPIGHRQQPELVEPPCLAHSITLSESSLGDRHSEAIRPPSETDHPLDLQPPVTWSELAHTSIGKEGTGSTRPSRPRATSTKPEVSRSRRCTRWRSSLSSAARDQNPGGDHRARLRQHPDGFNHQQPWVLKQNRQRFGLSRSAQCCRKRCST